MTHTQSGKSGFFSVVQQRYSFMAARYSGHESFCTTEREKARATDEVSFSKIGQDNLKLSDNQ